MKNKYIIFSNVCGAIKYHGMDYTWARIYHKKMCFDIIDDIYKVFSCASVKRQHRFYNSKVYSHVKVVAKTYLYTKHLTICVC